MDDDRETPRIRRSLWIAVGTTLNTILFMGYLAGGAAIYWWGTGVAERIADRDHRATAAAMYRIDPSGTRERIRAGADTCLRALLLEERRAGAHVSPLFVDSYEQTLAHHLSWRSNHDRDAYHATAEALRSATQQRYNESFATMSEAERADAMAMRRHIIAGADPRTCVLEEVARDRWDVFAAPEVGDGTLAFQGAALKR